MASEDRFGYEWDRYRDVDANYESQLKGWFGPLDPSFVRGKRVLDAGCGMGRNSYWCLRWGAESVVAFDNDSRTVDAARKTLAGFSNADVRLGSIYDITYESEFDFVFSIGVVHHLARPEEAVQRFARALKPGGTLLIWLYGREGNERFLKILDPFRIHITSKLPPRLLHVLTYGVSAPFWLWLHIWRPQKPYYQTLRRYSFWHVHSIIFDQFLPTIARYYTRQEALALFAPLKNVRIARVNANSWAVVGER